MKKVIIFLIMLLMVMPAGALTLKGGVKYTVESAREEAFRNIEYQISMEPHKKYLTDPGYTPGEGGKKPKISRKGRRIEYFSNGSYTARYYIKWIYIYIYSKEGTLDFIEVRNKSNTYPLVSWCYDVNGKLINATFWVSDVENYIYDLNGVFLAHWKDDVAYDKNGNIIVQRITK